LLGYAVDVASLPNDGHAVDGADLSIREGFPEYVRSQAVRRFALAAENRQNNPPVDIIKINIA
jgi:hypothetical protein